VEEVDVKSIIGCGTLAACMLGLAGHAQAQGALQFWHDEWQRQHHAQQRPYYQPHYQPRYQRRFGPEDGGWFFGPRPFGYAEWTPEDDIPQRRSRERAMPHVHVSNPDFLNYVPDTLQRVTFDSLCQQQTATNEQPFVTPVSTDSATALPQVPAMTPAPAPQSDFAQACAVTPTIALRVLPQVGKAITDYYASHPQFVWVDGDQVSGKARAAMAALAASDRFGLDPANYRTDAPDLQALDPQERLKALLRFDVTLSAKVLTYVLDATRGRIDPNRISGYHDLPRKSVDLVAALEAVAQSQDVASYLAQRNPDSPQFRALVTTLARLRAQTPAAPVHIEDGTVIRPGDSNPQLANVIAEIRQQASSDFKAKYAETLAAAADAQSYSGDLVDVVKAFQREKGLSADGIIGRRTIHALAAVETKSDKVAKLQLALERMRWLPRQLGSRYVFLNEPAYEVSYVNGSDKPLTMRVVVGRPDAQTYFFVDHIKNVQYNPYWNVPRSIVINEMLPRLYRDPSYLDEKGYEVSNRAGRQIASNSVNWAAVATDKIGVEVRQPPGKRNALGQLKIEFPNKHAIYLHDTNEKSFFKRERRALSHGCVRLQHPREMAAALLGTDTAHIGKHIASGETYSQAVPGNIPIYLAYFTAWPDAQGKVQYYDDVYDRDAHLQEAIEKTEAARNAR
jgi:murein L,D-transpeptidase YcbB/YkuD